MSLVCRSADSHRNVVSRAAKLAILLGLNAVASAVDVTFFTIDTTGGGMPAPSFTTPGMDALGGVVYTSNSPFPPPGATLVKIGSAAGSGQYAINTGGPPGQPGWTWMGGIADLGYRVGPAGAAINGQAVNGPNLVNGIWLPNGFVRVGESIVGGPTGNPTTVAGILANEIISPMVSVAGQVAWRTTLSGTGIPGGSTPGLVAGPPGGVRLIANTATPPPGLPAGYSWGGTATSELKPLGLTDKGHVLVQARFNGPGGVTGYGIWRGGTDGSPTQLVLREKMDAPGFAAGIQITALNPLTHAPASINEDGTIAVAASLTAPANSALFWGVPSSMQPGQPVNLVPIVKAGDPAPILGGTATLTSISRPVINKHNQIVFLGTMTGQQPALFMVSPDGIGVGGMTRIAQVGQIAPSGGTITAINRWYLNSSGHVAYEVGTSLGTAVLVSNRQGVSVKAFRADDAYQGLPVSWTWGTTTLGQASVGSGPVVPFSNNDQLALKVASANDQKIVIAQMLLNDGAMLDTDGDGLLDAWESGADPGLDVDGDGSRDITLPGANPLVKDIYIEVDAMQFRAPTQRQLELVQAAFAAAPETIQLHFENTNGLLNETDLPTMEFPNKYADLDTFKAAHFGTAAEQGLAGWLAGTHPRRIAKKIVYRYCVFGETHSGGASSGFSEIWGDEFTITLGHASTIAALAAPWRNVAAHPPVADTWRDLLVAGTFMHELGHSLGLLHGGADSINHKPNYHSIMSYTWQMPNRGFLESWVLDYSRVRFPDLNEHFLSEAAGFGGGIGHAGHHVQIGPFNNRQVVREDAPVDLNGNHGTGDLVNRDVNNCGAADQPSPDQILVGQNDWPNVRFSRSYNWRTGVHIPLLGDNLEPEIGPEEMADVAYNFPPTEFDLEAPANGATGVATGPTLDWLASGMVDHYLVVVDDNADFSSPALQHTEYNYSDYTLSTNALLPNTTYYWRVTAVNAAGSTDSAPDVFNFTTGAATPVALGDMNCDSILSPADLPPFVLALVDPGGYTTAFPGCQISHADMNEDGTINGDDVQGMVDAQQN